MNRKLLLKEKLIGNFLSINKFVINKFTDSFIDKTCAQKKITRLISLVIFLD